MFCEVMATTNSGMPILMVAASEKLGVVHTGVAISSWKPLKSITSSTPVVITRTVWQLAGILRATFDEVAKRPHPNKWYQRLGALPGLGAIAAYAGERGALAKAARDGVAWLDAHTEQKKPEQEQTEQT